MVIFLLLSFTNPLAAQDKKPDSPAGVAILPPPTPITLQGKPVFPVGLYQYPKHQGGHDIFKALAENGINLYLLPATATKEQLDAAQAAGVHVMLVVGDLLNLSGPPERIAEHKKKLAELVGPDSVAFKHPAVVALEGPDEPLWNVKMQQHARGGTHPERTSWVRTPDEMREIDALLDGLREGYAEVRNLAKDRYPIWINFAPRSDADELRWFTELRVVGGYAQDGRSTADVFGTDIYPVPGGYGNNGWIAGRLVLSPAAVGAFTEKLRRAVHPHPFYMVIQGCGVLEWDPAHVEARTTIRRPRLDELQFMAVDALIHGARGILFWGTHYIDDDDLYWRQIGVVARQLRALGPVLAQGSPWPDARPGSESVTVTGFLFNNERYVLAANNDPNVAAPGGIAVPGWNGDRAYSLLDGRTVPVEAGVIREPLPPIAARVYTDGTAVFKDLGRPRPDILAKRPMRTLFSLPVEMEPFAGKSPDEIAAILKSAGVDGVVKLPHDPKLVDALHKAGIKAYAEIACFSGKSAWDTFPNTRPVTSDGRPYDTEDGYGGLCLNQEDYVADLLARVDALLAEATWDGLWLDYLRWPGRWEEQDPKLTPLCFCDTCLARFTKDRTVHYPAELTTTKDKSAWILTHHADDWTAWKCDRVADVVSRIDQIMHRKLGPDALLGIFGVPMRRADFDDAVRRTFGQDASKLAAHVDVFSPMVYHLYCGRPLEWISQVTAEAAQQSGVAVWPIVQSCSIPADMSPEEFDRALHEGLTPPSTGIMVFSTDYTLKEGKWDTMSRVYNAAAAPAPKTP